MSIYRNVKKRGSGGVVYRGRRRQRGHGLGLNSFIKGQLRRRQRGHGLGSILGSIAKGASKIVKPIAKGAAKIAGRAAAEAGRTAVGGLVKQGGKRAIDYAVKNKGNIAKSVIGTAAGSALGLVGEKIGGTKRKKSATNVKKAVKKAKKADTQIKQAVKRKVEAVQQIEKAVGVAATPQPPAKKKRASRRGGSLNAIFPSY